MGRRLPQILHNIGSGINYESLSVAPEREAIIESESMKRVDLYLKVEVEVEEDEKPEKVAAEICRQIQKNAVVRSAEFSNAVTRE